MDISKFDIVNFTPSNPLRNYTSKSSISIPCPITLTLSFVRNFRLQLMVFTLINLPRNHFRAIYNLGKSKGSEGSLNTNKIMRANNLIFNLTSVIMYYIIGALLVELAEYLPSLAWNLNLYQEVLNLNLIPFRLL